MGEVYTSTAGLMGLIEHVEHPFGKGDITADGVQYNAETTIATTAYTAANPSAAAIYYSPNTKIREVEFGLTAGLYNSTTAGTLRFKWQASDDNVSWQDLNSTAITSAVSITTDFTMAGRFLPAGNFAGTANPFYVQLVAARSTGTVNVLAKTKASSYVKVISSPW